MVNNVIIERKLISQIEVFLDKKEYIAIIGPRQSGKSVFLNLIKNHLIENKNVSSANIKQITFEDRILLNQFDDDPAAFVNSYKRGIPDKDVFYSRLVRIFSHKN